VFPLWWMLVIGMEWLRCINIIPGAHTRREKLEMLLMLSN
jgi:hypothetical protein